MSLRPLVEGDCGAVNPLMQLGGQFTRDVAHKDEGFAQAPFERNLRPEEQLVNDFLGHVAAPPQTFQMNALLQEMRDINLHGGAPQQQQHHEMAGQWTRDFAQQQQQQQQQQKMVHMQPQQQQLQHAQEFFDEPLITSQNFMPPTMMMRSPYMAIAAPPPQQEQVHDAFFDQMENMETISTDNLPKVEDWISDYQREKEHSEQTATNFNEKFWQRLQDEWQKLAEENEHPWLSEYNENLDAYKEYEFAEQNPMSELDNAFEKGKEYLAKGDIPSAVLCFEVAAKKEPERAEVWQLLGVSQAENEMDPQGIAALKRALDLQPENRQVLMALAVCYTNESLQSNAVKMLSNWIEVHPQYKHLLTAYPSLQSEGTASMASSLIGANKLRELQQVYLEAVRMQPAQVDADLQEALGVLYNLSGEYDKAVDCYRSAVQVDPQNAKLWNRLGASLANGSRSVEAVEAYQQALQLQPGFIRVRYNVGVCCMNLKAYKEGAEHLLTALTMQAHTNAARELPQASVSLGPNQNQMSESIWSTLKMVISLMGRSDLQGHVSDRNLEALNEAFKD